MLHRMRPAAAFALVSLLFLHFAPAQAPTNTATNGAAERSEPATKRVHVIGASVSGGFRDGPMFGAKTQGDSITLQQLLKKWAGEHAKVTTHPTLQMATLFQDPQGIGKDQIERTQRIGPDVVVAVDFPFWFAYGYVDGDEAEARVALQRVCFDYLAQLEVPVIVGDLPDMRGAATRMLRPQQIPSPDVLRTLNANLRQFVDENEHVHLVEMAKLVRALKEDGAKLPLADGELQTGPGALLQEDRLHATRLGMALLGFTLQDELRARFPEGHPLREQRWSFEQFVAAAGAEGDLELVRSAVAAGK